MAMKLFHLVTKTNEVLKIDLQLTIITKKTTTFFSVLEMEKQYTYLKL